MGDVIEFTTKADCEFIFYKITSGVVRFSIKGEGNAAIILSKDDLIGKNYFWFSIGTDGKCTLQKYGSKLCETTSPNILSTQEYREFYISWGNGLAQLGKVNELPLLKESIGRTNLNYVSFVTSRRGHEIYWKVHMPPEIPTPKLLKLSGGEPQWVKAGDKLPIGVICGGFENETLYIIRAPHRGSLTPGKFVPSEGVGYIPWGGDAHEKEEFEALCGYNYTWVPTVSNKIPVGAVPAGFSEDYKREILYVGRAKCNGHVIVGKVQPTHKVCYVPFDGKEVAKSEFEVLVVPHANTRSVKKWFIREPTVNTTTNIIVANIGESSDSDSDDDIYIY